METEECVLCQQKKKEKLSNIRQGLEFLIEYSETFNLTIFRSSTTRKKWKRERNEGQVLPVKVHQSCQKSAHNSLPNKRKAPGDAEISSSKIPKLSTLSILEQFDWKIHLFCGKVCNVDSKHPDRERIHRGETKLYRETILDVSHEISMTSIKF